ncbi:hypothetical protein L1267_01750 [Pseudoalteromonas sp. OFAV1]|jgi:hypothetical protein|uniref:hypothetical protein n=1 Tax=Pseudoalteromonas sp. OFAV1 TaxID=2908892 RepID=UPI001F218DFC|nr:hypothetical protein [Pseudoalteromonas sp. OFAV1]MCF2899131.1 hypothetical protein [Pseudoalteromonas sp. OFAV1]
MSKHISLYLAKQCFIIITLLYSINFVCNEYVAWTAFIDCQSKCETLGIEKGQIQETTFKDDVILCRCLAENDYYVVLN